MRKKRRKRLIQPYIIGSLMIILVFALALLLMYISADKTAVIAVENISSDVISTVYTSENKSSEVTSQQGTVSEKLSSKTDLKPSNGRVSVEFSEEEIAQLEEVIARYETSLVPIDALSSTATSEVSSKPASGIGDSSAVSSEISNVMAKTHVSIYYEDIQSGYVYMNNPEYKYFIASLIKAPYCMYLFDLAEQGKCDLNEVLTIEYKKIQAGTGKIKDKKPEEFPLSMTVRELMSYAIRYSDNTAMETLRKKYDHVGYLTYAKSLGLKYPEDVLRIVNGKITAIDAGVYIKSIYNFIENHQYGGELKEDMSHTSNPLIRAKSPIVRKYGWARLSLHDMAIVYAPRPYLLVILTDKGVGTAKDNQLIAELSVLIEDFHNKRE